MVSNHIKPWPTSKQLDRQAVQVPGSKRPGQSGKLAIMWSIRLPTEDWFNFSPLSKWYTLVEYSYKLTLSMSYSYLGLDR
jgi:hypothetical protein